MAAQLEQDYLHGFADRKSFMYYHLVNMHSLAVTVQQANPGEASNSEATLTSFAGGVRIVTAEELEDLIDRANSTGSKAIAILENINAVKKLRQLIICYVSQKFNQIIERLHHSMLILDQYCISFSDLCDVTANMVSTKNSHMSGKNALKKMAAGSSAHLNMNTTNELASSKSNKPLPSVDENQTFISLLQTPVKYELSRTKLKEIIVVRFWREMSRLYSQTWHPLVYN
ncbi:hypothetical protein Ciccas_014319 [Cichlidogyrus casuarinus]|uniref:Uncharacterized protein n=1 Tax=Cichlidogyrus casuarinus TaxID=1844966 RepID=A0ABD2PJ13_9PLAT